MFLLLVHGITSVVDNISYAPPNCGSGSFSSGTNLMTFWAQSSKSLCEGLSFPIAACRMIREWAITSFFALLVRFSPFLLHSLTERGTTKLSVFASDCGVVVRHVSWGTSKSITVLFLCLKPKYKEELILVALWFTILKMCNVSTHSSGNPGNFDPSQWRR